MHEAVRQFVERVGLMLEADGLARSAGRIFGYLLICETPRSLDELADELQISKASASTNARLLEQHALVERIGSLGDRRDFYRIGCNSWEHMLRVAQRRWEAMHALLVESASQLPPEMAVGRERLLEAAEFHVLLLEGAERLSERWRERQSEEPASAVRALGG